MSEWDETGETRGRAAKEVGAAASQADLWRGLLSEGEPPVECEVREPLDEGEYPTEVRERAAVIDDATARDQLLTIVDRLYADRTRSTETLRLELARVAELGGGDLTRGLLRELSREAGEPIDGAETAWPESVATALSELGDWRARAELQHRAGRICPDPEHATPQQVAVLERLVAALRRGGDMQDALIAEWLKHHPERKPFGDRAAELPVWRERCGALRDRFEAGHPGVIGAERLVDRVTGQMTGPLYEMEIGRREVTSARLGNLAGSLRGIVGEWEAAVEHSAAGPVELGRKFHYADRETGERWLVDVDVLENEGRLWREVKNVRDFGTGSTGWTSLRRQVQRLLWAAEDNPLEGEATVRVCVELRRDARRSVVEALNEMGVDVEVKGRQIDDLRGERGLRL